MTQIVQVGWKNKSVGAFEDELLEETLYTRYFSYLDKNYSDFIMCPKIDKIETVQFSTRRGNFIKKYGKILLCSD